MDFTQFDPTVASAFIGLGKSLSELVLKGTATVVHGKIDSMKNERNVESLRNSYNEIVNQLLAEREEALMIAQTYKQELDKVSISDEDIEYLQQTVSKVLDLIVALQIVDIESEDLQKRESAIDTVNGIKAIKNLISKDVLKTMQLLGFNYKAAIGEPLTEICGNAIRNIGKKKVVESNNGTSCQ